MNHPIDIWVFYSGNHLPEYIGYHANRKTAISLAKEYQNNIITKPQKFSVMKGSSNNPYWIVFDKANNNYAWIYQNKAKAIKRYLQHKFNESYAQLSPPKKYYMIE